MFKITKLHVMGIIAAVIILAVDLIFLRSEKVFYFLLGIGIIVGAFPFLLTILGQTEKEKEKERMFLEFSRNLVESVKSGTPISRSIMNVKGKDYGSLTPHIDKLANQIALGIPVKSALEIFAKDINSKVVSRAITLISEAEQAGGEIETILESVATSVSQTEKLKKEQKSAVYALVVQGYIIFVIFIIIMLVMEFKIIPMTQDFTTAEGFEDVDMSNLNVEGLQGIGTGQGLDPEETSNIFLAILITQGLFAGLTIGKLAEGNIRSGLKHSFILVALAWLISSGARVFFT